MRTEKTIKEIISYLKNLGVYAPVSVVIPCYNNQETIENAILSVINQSWRPEELILVDDASKDKTLETIEKIKKENDLDWVRVIALSKNQGPSIARNKGWDNGTQPYIAFLDADDIWNKDKIAIQMYYMIQNKEVVLSGHRYLLKKEKDHDFTTFLFSKIKIKKIPAQKWLFCNYYSVPGVIIKRQLPYRFQTSKRYAEDYFLWMQIAFDGYKMMLIDLPLAYGEKMYFGEAGLSKNLWKMELSQLGIFLWLFKQRKISFLKTCLILCWSLIKYARRVIITYLWAIYYGIKNYIR